MKRAVRKVLRAVANYDPDYYDMHEDANETLFAHLYLEHILQHAEAAGIRPPATILEAGCQAGRLVIPLAKQGFRVTGVDTSGFGLRRAQAHAKAAGVEAAFIRGDIIEVLRRQPQSYDLVICAEVVYLSPDYRQMLQALAGAVRPGGLLCVSHRPKFYYLIEALKQYDIEIAARVLATGEGAFRDSQYYNWQTTPELKSLYEQTLGLRWLAMHPIDRLAWLSGMSPSKLPEAQRAQWLELELNSAGAQDSECARYLLVVAMKPGADGRA